MGFAQKVAAVCLSVTLLASVARATPFELSYMGRLVEDSGRPVEGPVDLEITFHNAANGSDRKIAVEPLVMRGIPLVDGVFHLTLALSPADRQKVFADEGDAVYLQLTDLTHNKTYARHKYAAMPYALKVPVDQKTLRFDADGKLGLAVATPVPGKFLAVDGSGNLSWATPAGSGDMTKATYDGDADDIVDNAEKLNGQPAAHYLNADNHTSGSVNKVFTAAEKAKLATVATNAGVVSYTSVEGAGAVMNSDFTVDGLMRRSSGGTFDTIPDGSTNWTTGFNERLRWDGGATGLDAAAGRTSLGLGTAAQANTGTAVGNVLVFSQAGKLPALDGSALTNLPAPGLGAPGPIGGTTPSTATFTTVTANTSARLKDGDGTDHYVTLKAPTNVGADVTYTLPAAADAGKYLKTDGSGNLTWEAPAGLGNMMTLTYDTLANGIVDDAEKLGGNAPSYYRNASNLNSGAVPAAQLPLATNGAIGAMKATTGKITLDGTGAITAINADTAATATDASALGGNAPSFYRDAANLNAGTMSAARLPIATDGAVGAMKATSGRITLDMNGAITAIHATTAASATTAGSATTATSATTAASFSGNLAGDVTGTQGATAIAADAVTSAKIANGTIVGADINTATTIDASGFVARDATTLQLREQTASGSNYVALKAPNALAVNTTYTLPLAADAGKFLQTNAAGDLSWVDPVAGLGTAATKNAGTAAGEVLLLATANQLPALDGSLLTNLPSIDLTSPGPIGSNLADTGNFTVLTAQALEAADSTGLRLYDDAGNGIYVKDGGNVGIGNTVADAKLHVSGQVKITGGTPGLGKVLTSDAAGLATWVDPVASGAAGGDLDGSYPNPTIRAGRVTSSHIVDASIVNADISGTAAIDPAKIATDSDNRFVTDTERTNWDKAYDERASWDGSVVGNTTVRATARGNLGLGTAAVKDFGTGAGQLVELASASTLPALNGSALTSLTPGNLSAAVPLSKGGTGATDQPGAANAVLPAQVGNNGRYLMTNGTNVAWTNVLIPVLEIGANVGGSTNGSLLFIDNNGLAEENSKLYWDKTNDRLGIGTAGPDVALHVQGTNSVGAEIKTTTTGAANAATLTLRRGDAANGQAKIDFFTASSATWEVGTKAGSNGFSIHDAAVTATRLHIDTSGRVGLGTMSATNRLDVEGAVAIGNGYSGTNTAPANGMIVEGNVGIGVTGPTDKLEVSGDIKASGSLKIGLLYRNYSPGGSGRLRCACPAGSNVIGGSCFSSAYNLIDDFITVETTDGTSLGTRPANNATSAGSYSCDWGAGGVHASNTCIAVCARIGS